MADPVVVNTNIQKFLAWLKQPSTIKAIILFLGLAGYQLAPEKLDSIVEGVVVLYGGVAMFLDKG